MCLTYNDVQPEADMASISQGYHVISRTVAPLVASHEPFRVLVLVEVPEHSVFQLIFFADCGQVPVSRIIL